MRYLRQRDQFTCGPVAIMNAIRWAGGEARYEDKFDDYVERCRCVPPWGTKHGAFDRVLREEGGGLYEVRRVYRPTIPQMTQHLLNGGAVILNYRSGEKHKDRRKEKRHFYLLIEASPFGLIFGTVNRNRNTPAFSEVAIMSLEEDCRNRQSDPSFKAWFLTREE